MKVNVHIDHEDGYCEDGGRIMGSEVEIKYGDSVLQFYEPNLRGDALMRLIHQKIHTLVGLDVEITISETPF